MRVPAKRRGIGAHEFMAMKHIRRVHMWTAVPRSPVGFAGAAWCPWSGIPQRRLMGDLEYPLQRGRFAGELLTARHYAWRGGAVTGGAAATAHLKVELQTKPRGA